MGGKRRRALGFLAMRGREERGEREREMEGGVGYNDGSIPNYQPTPRLWVQIHDTWFNLVGKMELGTHFMRYSRLT